LRRSADLQLGRESSRPISSKAHVPRLKISYRLFAARWVAAIIDQGRCSREVIVQNHGCASGACGWRIMRPTTLPALLRTSNS
jgi:hypothetical protein